MQPQISDYWWCFISVYLQALEDSIIASFSSRKCPKTTLQCSVKTTSYAIVTGQHYCWLWTKNCPSFAVDFMLIRCTKKAMDYEFLVLLLAHCFFNLKSLCVGVSSIKGFQLSITPLGLLHQEGGFDDIRSMLASMTISSTISPFVIDDNNSCSPFVFISPPLASMEKGVHIPMSEIFDHCWLLPLSICTILGPFCIPGVTIISPLSSSSSLMNSKCDKVFERPYTWLSIWNSSSLLW